MSKQNAFRLIPRLASRLALVGSVFAAVACSSDDSSSSAPSAGAGSVPPGGVAGAANPGAPAADPGVDPAAPAGEVTPGESAAAGGGDTPLDEASAGQAQAGAGGAGAETEVAAAGAGGAAAAGAPGASPFPSDVTRPRIMIVGDSISAGPGCYKRYLLADLNANGYTNFDFVGEYTDDCGGGVMHSARSCTTALDYTQPTFTLRDDCGGGMYPGLATLMATHDPDLLMLQLGVNDVWNGVATDTILANYATLLEQARAANPNIVVAIAQIHQIRPTNDGDAVFARAQALVEAVPAWAQAQNQPTSPVFVADLWTNSDVADAPDGVHPEMPGAERMAGNWFETLRGILPPD